MLFLLDTILILNIWIAIRYFKNLISPPVLMGGGMLAAAIVATLYYDEWNMKFFHEQSVLILGGGTIAFTFYCIILSKSFPRVQLHKINEVTSALLKTKRIEQFYYIAIIIGVIGIMLNINYMISHWGTLGLTELIGAKRADHWSGTNTFVIPSYIRQMGSLTEVVSYFTVWLLSIVWVLKQKIVIKKRLQLLIYFHLVLAIINGMLSGTKGPIFAIIVQLFVFVLVQYYAKKGSYNLNKRMLTNTLIILFLLFFSFRGINLLVGRNYTDRKNSDVFIEYCGAQIKNFDIYIHRNTNGEKSNTWGEKTFLALYSELNPNKQITPGEFQSVGNYNLGNVYTQYRPFHEDFGIIGVFTMNFIIAFISMFFYHKAMKSLLNPTKLNIYLFIYASMAINLFMSFFSSKFTENIFSIGGWKTFLYMTIFTWFAKKYLLFHNKY